MVLPPEVERKGFLSSESEQEILSLLYKDKKSPACAWEKSIGGKNTIREVYTPEGSSPGPLVREKNTVADLRVHNLSMLGCAEAGN